MWRPWLASGSIIFGMVRRPVLGEFLSQAEIFQPDGTSLVGGRVVASGFQGFRSPAHVRALGPPDGCLPAYVHGTYDIKNDIELELAAS